MEDEIVTRSVVNLTTTQMRPLCVLSWLRVECALVSLLVPFMKESIVCEIQLEARMWITFVMLVKMEIPMSMFVYKYSCSKKNNSITFLIWSFVVLVCWHSTKGTTHSSFHLKVEVWMAVIPRVKRRSPSHHKP